MLGAALGFVLAIYLTGVAVRLADRLSPGLGGRMSNGPVVSTLSEWALGLEEMVPQLPRPAMPRQKQRQPPPSEKPEAPKAPPGQGVPA